MNLKINPRDINTTALAYMGDAVYEIYVREHALKSSCCGGGSGEGTENTGSVSFGAHVDAMHKRAVRYVRAGSQAGSGLLAKPVSKTDVRSAMGYFHLRGSHGCFPPF